MVIFEVVRWKNFLSTGNAFTEVFLNQHDRSLIYGKNGSGKSTFLDAITFALFGKAFRDINKPALVNSVNDKNCVVELELDIDGKKFKIIRGIKPVIFEIWTDGVMMNQDSASRDYQKVLEQQILKFNYKTFNQVVVLGSANYTPFMKLPLASRREIVEDLLDIRIFSIMNKLLKEDVDTTKSALVIVNSKLDMSKSKIESQRKLIDVIIENITKKEAELKAELQRLEREYDTISDKIVANQNSIDNEYDQLESQYEEVEKSISDIKASISANKKALDIEQKQIKFFEINNECSVCRQDISSDHRDRILDTLHKNCGELTNTTEALESNRDENVVILNSHRERLNKLKELQTENKHLRGELKKNLSRMKDVKETISENTDTRLSEEKDKLKEIAKNGTKFIEDKKRLSEQKHVQELSSLLLKDSGIKSTIIKEYLPIFNRLINKYLSVMELYVDFQLDETFNESMKARYRDSFSYASFSEGEKQRIDIALLFTFREIAKMKNSLSTNLLIMDEVFDSSLDVNGVDFVINLLNELENTNTFIISHNVNLIGSDSFSDSIMFEKQGDFSVKSSKPSRFRN